MMCAGFGLIGFALALETSQGNGFVASFKDPATRLGFLHASYGMYTYNNLRWRELISTTTGQVWARSRARSLRHTLRRSSAGRSTTSFR
jgi:hypothetical protein